MAGIPDSFPDVLREAVPDSLDAEQHAVIAAPELAPFWQALAAHTANLMAAGWSPTNAACTLVGCVLTPLAMGYDASGTLPTYVRKRVDMARRREAADCARKLADMLDAIRGEPLPPDAVVSVAALLDPRLIARAPSYFQNEPTSELLRRLADALEEPPRFADAPGLASQKPGWRGFLREVATNLRDLGFDLRERDAARLVQAVCREAGMVAPPSRDAVRDALRVLGFGRISQPKSAEKTR